MGVAAYQRGTMVNRRRADRECEELNRRMDLKHTRQMFRDLERLDAAVKEYSERFHYFYAAEWWRDARIARLKGLAYRAKRDRIANRLRRMGWKL